MRRLMVALYLGCFSNVVYAQNAIFSIETERLEKVLASGGRLPDRVRQSEWIIDGRKLQFGSEPVEVGPNPNQLDTILFRGSSQSAYDTILCNISEPGEYRFYYNDCCGNFKVRNMSLDKVFGAKIIFKLSGAIPDTQFLGTVGRTGTLVSSTVGETITDECRSAMASNVYSITFSEVQTCAEEADCAKGLCLVKSLSQEIIWDFGYDIISEKANFLYMPLGAKPLIVTYHPGNGKIEIQ